MKHVKCKHCQGHYDPEDGDCQCEQYDRDRDGWLRIVPGSTEIEGEDDCQEEPRERKKGAKRTS